MSEQNLTWYADDPDMVSEGYTGMVSGCCLYRVYGCDDKWIAMFKNGPWEPCFTHFRIRPTLAEAKEACRLHALGVLSTSRPELTTPVIESDRTDLGEGGGEGGE